MTTPRRRRGTICSALALLAVASGVTAALPAGVPSHFADFGPAAGDSRTRSAEFFNWAASGTISKFSANILGRRGDGLRVWDDGYLAFGSHYDSNMGTQPKTPPFSTPFARRDTDGNTPPAIAAIWGDLQLFHSQSQRDDVTLPDTLYYRVVSGAAAESLARPGLLPRDMIPTRAVVATWYSARAAPRESVVSQKHSATVQLLVFVNGSNAVPSCKAPDCVGGTVAVWRYSGDTPAGEVFGAGVDSGLAKTGAVCRSTADAPELSRQQCDVALLPFYAMADAPKRLAQVAMTTEWGTKLNAGEFSYRLDRPLESPAPAKRSSEPPVDPSVPDSVAGLLPPTNFAPFGPAAGDMHIAACEGECVSNTFVRWRANMFGQGPDGALISNWGYLSFLKVNGWSHEKWSSLGSTPKPPPFRPLVTGFEVKTQSPATFAALWGRFDTSKPEYAGTAPRPNTVYYRTAGRHESARLAGAVGDEITNIRDALVVTWYRVAQYPAPEPGLQASYSSAQFVLLMNGSMYSLFRPDETKPNDMGRTVAVLRYDAGRASNVVSGAGASGGLAGPMCELRKAEGYRFDPNRCDGFTLPDFRSADLASTLADTQQLDADGSPRVSGQFAFRLDRPQYTAATGQLPPVTETPVVTPVPSLPPPTPSHRCAATWKAPAISEHLHPGIVFVLIDRSPRSFGADAAKFMCLPADVSIEFYHSRLVGSGNGLPLFETRIRLIGGSVSSMRRSNGRMKFFAEHPLSGEAKAAGVYNVTYYDADHPLPAAPVPAPVDPQPNPAPDASCSGDPPAPMADADPGLALFFALQPSLDIINTLLPHLCLPAGSRLEATPVAVAASGYYTTNVSLRLCAGAAVDSKATSGCAAEAAARLKAFASAPLPGAVSGLGVKTAMYVADIGKTAPAPMPDDGAPIDCAVPAVAISVKQPRLLLRTWRKPTAGLADDVASMLCLGGSTTLRARAAPMAFGRRSAGDGAAALGGDFVAHIAVIEIEICDGAVDEATPGFADCAASVAGRMDQLSRAAPRSGAVTAASIVSVTLQYDVPTLPVAPPLVPPGSKAGGGGAGGFFSNTGAVAGLAVGVVGLVVAVAAAVLVFVFVIRPYSVARTAIDAPMGTAEPVYEDPIVGEPVMLQVKASAPLPEVNLSTSAPSEMPQVV